MKYKKHILIALSHISWVIKHSGTNVFVEGYVLTALSNVFEAWSTQK